VGSPHAPPLPSLACHCPTLWLCSLEARPWLALLLLLVVGICSFWVMMNLKTRRLAKITDEIKAECIGHSPVPPRCVPVPVPPAVSLSLCPLGVFLSLCPPGVSLSLRPLALPLEVSILGNGMTDSRCLKLILPHGLCGQSWHCIVTSHSSSVSNLCPLGCSPGPMKSCPTIPWCLCRYAIPSEAIPKVPKPEEVAEGGELAPSIAEEHSCSNLMVSDTGDIVWWGKDCRFRVFLSQTLWRVAAAILVE